MEKELLRIYRERVSLFTRELKIMKRKGNLLSLLRLLIFITGKFSTTNNF